MTLTHPFLQQIDHIGIQADNPRALFEFFTEVLGLPAALPYVEYPYYTSGSVVLGNISLEIMRFGSSRATPRTPSTRYHILGFLTRPGTLACSPAELERRGVPHSGLVPFFAPEATDENPIAIWANVYLGGLLGENAWMRLLFAMTKKARPKPSLMCSPLLNKISLALMAPAFRDGLPVLTKYYLNHDDAKRAADWEALRQRQGGGDWALSV
jgi:catechol 2,3-dioxygenase-like lactoylglutathione lyase family enzyme